MRAALDRSIARMDARMQSGLGWSDERLSAFKRQMAERDVSDGEFCSEGDGSRFLASILASDPDEIERQTTELVDRPGAPEWGTCL